MSGATVRDFSGERRTSAEVKDPAGRDTLGVEAPAAPGSAPMVSPYDEVVRQPANEGAATREDDRRELPDAVTKSLDSKGADAE
ncbi:hypothetical protein KYY02_08090 [Streptomyces pimonensis]|uniref:Uncharacterized protein n=1 Tax=Streptomyces pimonensis TaxID=2860288 RepID=A0ABV4IVF9_9ACTN